jgi:hypothetical protein
MDKQAADGSAVGEVPTASRTLVGVATRSPGAAAEHTTIAQYRALVVLASRGPLRLIDLAEALDVAPSTAGRMGDRLVREQLVRPAEDRQAIAAAFRMFAEAAGEIPDSLWPAVPANDAPPALSGTWSGRARAGRTPVREGW